MTTVPPAGRCCPSVGETVKESLSHTFESANTIDNNQTNNYDKMVFGRPSLSSGKVADSFRGATGVFAVLEDLKEKDYHRTKKQPLGRSSSNFSAPLESQKQAAKVSAKDSICPRGLAEESEIDHNRYVKSHGDFLPGEQLNRHYEWPVGISRSESVFGKPARTGAGGVSEALIWDRPGDSSKIVSKRSEDFREISRLPLGRAKSHFTVPPANIRFGKKNENQSGGVADCLVDLHVPEKINISKNDPISLPPSGVPSIRADIPVPSRRSFSDMQNYGDDFGTSAVLNPQRFQDMGVSESDFKLEISRDKLWQMVASFVCESDFETILGKSASMSLQKFILIYGELVKTKVGNNFPKIDCSIVKNVN